NDFATLRNDWETPMSSAERLAFGAGTTLVGVGRPYLSPYVAARHDLSRVDPELFDRAAYRALLIFMVVLLTRPQDQLPFLEPLHLASITGWFAVIAYIVGRASRGAVVCPIGVEVGAVLALAVVMLATTPFSVWPGGAFGIFTDVFSNVIVVFVLMVNTVNTRDGFDRLVTVVVLGTTYIAVRGLVDYARGVNLVEGDRLVGAVGGLFGNPNDLALNMVAVLPLAVIRALDRRRPLVRVLALIGVPSL